MNQGFRNFKIIAINIMHVKGTIAVYSKAIKSLHMHGFDLVITVSKLIPFVTTKASPNQVHE